MEIPGNSREQLPGNICNFQISCRASSKNILKILKNFPPSLPNNYMEFPGNFHFQLMTNNIYKFHVSSKIQNIFKITNLIFTKKCLDIY